MSEHQLHVAHVITGLVTGGAERMLSKVSLAMDSIGVESTVLAGLGGSMEHELRKAGTAAHVIWRKPSGLQDAPSFGAFLRRCARGEFDGFLGWMYHGNLLATILGGVCGRPVVWSIRQSLSDEQQDKPLTRLAIRAGAVLSGLPRAIIYNSHVAAAMHRARGYKSDTEVMIPNGFDPDAFFPDAPAAVSFRVRHALPMGDRVIGLVARNHPMKDFPTFVDMASRVWEQRKDVHFLLVGAGLVERHSNVQRLVAKTGCADRFLILDERADLREVYSVMDVFCLTSKSNEAFPNVLGEAMFCGVPCVTTDVGDAAAIVGEFGRVVRVGDAATLARNILSILDMDAGPYRALSQSVRERAVRLYSLDRVAEQYANVCRESMQVRR